MNFSLSAQLISALQQQPSVTLISLQGNFYLPAGFNECIRREELGVKSKTEPELVVYNLLASATLFLLFLTKGDTYIP